MSERTKAGTFKKGVSGNPSGRPKSSKMTSKDRKEFKDDPMGALMYLMNTAETSVDVYKYAKELLPYCKPKLSSIKSEIEQETTVTIKIEGFEGISMEQPKQVVDESNVIDLTAEEVETVAADRVDQLKKAKKKK